MNNEQKRLAFLNEAKKVNWTSDFKMVEKFLKPYILIDTPFKPQGIKIGQSKFGGKPDLPKNTDWPKYNNEPMVFIGQLNIRDFKKLDVENILPKAGIIYYFAYFKEPESKWGTEYDFIVDKEKYIVIYSENDTLITADFPKELPDAYHFNEQELVFDLMYSLPVRESLEIKNFNEEDEENLWDFNEQFGSGEGGQILGYCSPIQADVTWDWAFSDLGFDTYDLSESDLARIDSIRPEFINILQFSLENEVTGFKNIGISIGYFGIKRADLKNKRFDETILIFQDT
ncbi:MAG: DUF1963 domain-containing protein [Cryomorphaceae bacterium]|nr:DUF1963 domain-containing protein [Cryomorphaceae bacterium]